MGVPVPLINQGTSPHDGRQVVSFRLLGVVIECVEQWRQGLLVRPASTLLGGGALWGRSETRVYPGFC